MTNKAEVREDAIRLEDIPNIGPSIANDLRMIGVQAPAQLIGGDPYQLYDQLCQLTQIRHDPCVIDCFISAVRFMEGAPKLPWWHYTPERKQHLNKLEALRP
jgi:Pathogenicity locus